MEILLLLERAGYRRAADLMAATSSRSLASAAKWSRDASKSLREFIDDLREFVDPGSTAPAIPSPTQIAAFMSALGVPQEQKRAA